VLKNGFPPWRDNGNLTEEKFFVDLASNLKSSQKVIYKSAAEVQTINHEEKYYLS